MGFARTMMAGVRNTTIEEQDGELVTVAPPRAARTSKKDRPFSPPDLTMRLWAQMDAPEQVREIVLRPSTAGIAQKVLDHYGRTRNDQEYRREWETHLRGVLAQRVEEQRRLEAKREAARLRDKEDRPYVPPMRVRASEIKNCARQVAMRLMRFQEAPIGEDSPHWAVSARLGDLIHEELEAVLAFLGLSEKQEYMVYSKNGSFAGRVDDKLRVDRAILDIKTVKADDWREGPYSDKVPGYIAQVSAYARLEKLPKGIILLVNRDNGKMLDYEWDVDPVYADAVLNRADWIVVQARNRQLPPPEGFDRGQPSFACRNFCPFFAQCAAQEQDGSIQAALDEGVSVQEIDARLLA